MIILMLITAAMSTSTFVYLALAFVLDPQNQDHWRSRKQRQHQRRIKRIVERAKKQMEGVADHCEKVLGPDWWDIYHRDCPEDALRLSEALLAMADIGQHRSSPWDFSIPPENQSGECRPHPSMGERHMGDR